MDQILGGSHYWRILSAFIVGDVVNLTKCLGISEKVDTRSFGSYY